MNENAEPRIYNVRAVDNPDCGVAVTFENYTYVLTGIETGRVIERTVNPNRAALAIGAYLMEYALADECVWAATLKQGSRIIIFSWLLAERICDYFEPKTLDGERVAEEATSR